MGWAEVDGQGDKLAAAIAAELAPVLDVGCELELELVGRRYVFVCSGDERQRQVGAFVLEDDQVEPSTMGDASSFVWPSEVLDYIQMWSPYVEGTVTALQACATATTDATIAQQTKTNAYYLESSWHAYDNYDGFDFMNNAPRILTNLQQALVMASLFAQQASPQCPSQTFPQPVPGPSQSAAIALLQNAGYVAAGDLEILAAGAGGVLQAAGTVAKKAGSALAGLGSFLTEPWLWLALVAVSVAYVVGVTGLRAPKRAADRKEAA